VSRRAENLSDLGWIQLGYCAVALSSVKTLRVRFQGVRDGKGAFDLERRFLWGRNEPQQTTKVDFDGIFFY
jgi:hypothetical protein